MALVPRRINEWPLDPFRELETLQREMNRLFDFSLAKAPDVDTGFWGNEGVPMVDIADAKDRLVVRADLPGMSKEDIEVSIQENLLTIRGEKKKNAEVKEENTIRTERFYGTFQRSFTLPVLVDSANVKASFKDGVLELDLPKREEAKPKQIKVDIK